VVLGGRSWIIHADSLLVDLQCANNWKHSWMWDPPPWRSTMKLAGFDGTYDEWIKRHPPRQGDAHLARLDASRREELVDLNLDQAALHAHMVGTMKDIDRLMPSSGKGTERDGLGTLRRLSVLAGNESSVPRLRRGAP
jgi:hypothetical protein